MEGDSEGLEEPDIYQGMYSYYCFSPSVNHLSITHANIHFSLSVTMVTQIILFPNFVLCVNQLLQHDWTIDSEIK